MANDIDQKEFWEQKIREWEHGRYEDVRGSGSWLEKFANRASDSLRNRVRLAGEILAPRVSGKHVVEIGCGSGLLASAMLEAGALSYSGYDIAETAIENAVRSNADLIAQGRVTFQAKSIDDLSQLDADIVFSLGLLDWLQDREIARLFSISGKADYLHAIAERRFSVQRLLHKAYVYVSYGHRTGSYIPRYFTPAEIKSLADQTCPRTTYVYRDPALSFGAFVSSFSYAGTEKI